MIFRFIKSIFGFDIQNVNCMSLSNEQSLRPIIIDLNPGKPLYYQFVVILDRCDGICNTLHDLSHRFHVLNKCNRIIGINGSWLLAKHISYDYR